MWRISSKHDLQDGREIVAYLSCDRVQNGGQADISKGCKDVHRCLGRQTVLAGDICRPSCFSAKLHWLNILHISISRRSNSHEKSKSHRMRDTLSYRSSSPYACSQRLSFSDELVWRVASGDCAPFGEFCCGYMHIEPTQHHS